jgi:hypothetical protein
VAFRLPPQRRPRRARRAAPAAGLAPRAARGALARRRPVRPLHPGCHSCVAAPAPRPAPGAEFLERRAEAAALAAELRASASGERRQQDGGGPAGGGPDGGAGEPPAAAEGRASSAAAAAAAAAEAARLLSRPLGDFSASRREWVLKVAKALSQGFLAQAQGAGPAPHSRACPVPPPVPAALGPVGRGLMRAQPLEAAAPRPHPPLSANPAPAPPPKGYMSNPAPFKDPDPTAADAAVVSAGLVDALAWLQARRGSPLTHWGAAPRSGALGRGPRALSRRGGAPLRGAR